MDKLVIFIALCYGMSNIIVFGSIFNGFRNYMEKISPEFFGKLFSCMICLPTWIGFLMSWVFYSPTLSFGLQDLDLILFSIPKEAVSIFLDGCLASGCVWLVHSFQEALERHYS